jgi:hypothetical protein
MTMNVLLPRHQRSLELLLLFPSLTMLPLLLTMNRHHPPPLALPRPAIRLTTAHRLLLVRKQAGSISGLLRLQLAIPLCIQLVVCRGLAAVGTVAGTLARVRPWLYTGEFFVTEC